MSWQLDIELFAVTSNKSARMIQVCSVLHWPLNRGGVSLFAVAVAQYEADLSFSGKTSKYLTLNYSLVFILFYLLKL